MSISSRMKQSELIPHLFRTEFSKITAVLCKRFGIEYIEMAEDMASETFLAALETWPYKGVPPNPTAWLYAVARNKAVNFIGRNQLFADKIAGELEQTSSETEQIEIDLSEGNITDSRLQMLFALCHPTLSTEAQIALALRVLCGFGIEEIANAFLTNKEVINKRLFRAKEKLRLEKVKIEFPDNTEITSRIDTVLTTLYLLFSEGYYSESKDAVLREDLCQEAMRLTHLLIENNPTNQPDVNALLALMYFHASRFEARKDENDEIILYEDQDGSRWNYEWIAKGAYFLRQASQGNRVSKYHVEASIAYWFTIKNETDEKWPTILHLYNQLLVIEYSPIAALNRTYALSKVKGNLEAIAEAEKLNLVDNHFYYALLGELYTNVDRSKSRMNFLKAHSLAKTQAEKHSLQKKIDALQTMGGRSIT